MNNLEETKNKKPYTNKTYTTGDPALNIAHFNKDFNHVKDFGSDGSYMNSTINPGEGSGDSAGGEACGESLSEQKIFVSKAKDFVKIPDFINLQNPAEVSKAIARLSPEEEFTVGYVTPIYFYKKLLDRFTLVKLTEMTGYTGVDYRDVTLRGDVNAKSARIAKAQTQIDNPLETTYYGQEYNDENNVVKSRIQGMRKNYDDINKVVKQANHTVYKIDPKTGRKLLDKDGNPIVKAVLTDLKTILFYPKKNSFPKVNYYIDLKDGTGFFKVDRAVLVNTIYKKVEDIITQDYTDGNIDDDYELSEMEQIFLQDVAKKAQAIIDSDAKTAENRALSQDNNRNGKPEVRSLYTGQIYMLKTENDTLGKELVENLKLKEAKRYVRRYYIRPQDIFCSNKAEILKALIDIDNDNCTVYTLNNLGDEKDVNKLTNDDIIYYYDDGILYDKNKVKVMDYDLYIKHEEKRDNIKPNQVSDAKFNDVYDDRMTDQTVVEGLIPENEFDLSFDSLADRDYNFLTEEANKDNTCCICGEEIDGYGNNAEPYKKGRCCDSCNLKFVIPARLNK